jgi:spermidine synthase
LQAGDFNPRAFFCNITDVKPLEPLAQTLSPDGTLIKLARRGDEYLLLAGTAVLMSSRMHGSEEALATLACQRTRTLPHPRVLIGGLGMGFTLRATLDLLSPHATVVVAELVPAVVEWNRATLGPLAGHPLEDQRVQVETGDVSASLRSHVGQFDAVLLDVDNGPAELTSSNNAALYDKHGLAAAHAALKPEGVLAVWAVKDDRKFQQRLRTAGFNVQVHRPRARLQSGGPRHAIFLAQKS